MRSRLRKLHIDGREYTWKADVRAAPGPDGRRHRCIRIRVWGGGKTGCALQADVAERAHPAAAEERYPYPVAADVRALIDHGLRAGWVPATRGGTFQITSGADVALPGFVLTDLLWTAEQRQT
ncbi:integrase [Dactylosporangium sp. NPDC050688]|uniref:integrase n=1 Tax=Dactylosporangium sp. NPDC050688 TaxID=3157217 RepID=UPI0033EF2ACE